MTDFNIIKHYTIFIFFVLIFQSSTPYQMLSLENDRLCSSTTKQKITLGPNSSSGLIVSLSNATKLMQHTRTWGNDIICEFQVNTADMHNGLFVVLQNIVFRSDDLTKECVDYVEYRRQNVSVSKRYCGQMNTDFASAVDAFNLTPTINSFVEPIGVLDVYIYISGKRLRPYRKLELEMVFTSYRYCFRNSSRDDQPCGAKYATHCIYKNFVNDGYVNCPYPGCVDETKCSIKVYDEDKDSYGFRVAISSVVVMLLLSAVVSLYLCRKLKKLCWNEDFNAYQRPHVVEINEPTTRHQPNTYAVGPLPEDGSLPPSYNSLFPDK